MNARRQDNHAGTALAACWRAGLKRAAQVLGIIADRLHLDRAEKFREHLQHGFAIFQHIADTGRGAGVVLQHKKVILAGAHNICADDMGIDIAGRAKVDHLRQKSLVLGNQINRYNTGAKNFLTVIDVVQKRVDGIDTLFNPLGQLGPFARRNNTRHQIKGNQTFFGICLAVDVECDPGSAKERFGVLGLFGQARVVLTGKPAIIFGIGRAGTVGALHLAEVVLFLHHSTSLDLWADYAMWSIVWMRMRCTI